MGGAGEIYAGGSGLIKKLREEKINKISNFVVASLFTAAAAVGGGKILFDGIQNENDASIYAGAALIAGGATATYCCINKIKKSWRELTTLY